MFENKILEKRFLPAFLNGLSNEFLIVPCLSPIFAILNKSDLHINFEKIVWPHLKSLFTLKSMPAQCLYFLLQKVEFIGDKVSKSEFSNNFLKIICKALDCNVLKIQTVVADHIIYITKKIDSLTFKNQVYPRIITTLQTTNSQQLKIKLLNSMKELYKLLDQNTINENLLNNLDKIRKSDNGAEICMLISSIYEEIAKVVTIISIANKILPNLISILVSGNISKGNFDSLMSIVHKYLDRIKKDREKDLYDDNAPQKKKDDIISEIEESKNKKNDNKGDDDFLNAFFSSNNTISTNNNTYSNNANNNNNTGGLEFLDNISLSSNPTTNLSQNNNLNTNNNTQSNSSQNINFDFSTPSNSTIQKNKTIQPNINLSNTNISKNFSLKESNFGQNNTLNKNTITPNVSNNNNLNFDFNLSGTNTNQQNTSSTSNYTFNTNNTQQQNKAVNLDNLLNDLDKPSVQPTTSNNNLNMNINLGMSNFNTGNQNTFMQTQTQNQNQSNSGFDQMNLNFLTGNNNISSNNTMNFNLNPNNNNNMNFNMNNNMNMMNMNNMNFNMGNMNMMNQNNLGNMNIMNQNNNNSNNNFDFNFQTGNSNSNNNNNNSNNPFTFL